MLLLSTKAAGAEFTICVSGEASIAVMILFTTLFAAQIRTIVMGGIAGF
jgi:hypothetical protein